MPHEKENQGLSASQGCGDTGGSLPAANLEALQDLIARVEAARGPSMSLSRGIQCSIGGWYRRTPSEGRTRHPTFIHPDDCRNGKPIYDSLHGTDIWREPPDVSASLDAALALVERVLPDHDWIVEGGKRGSTAVLLASVAEDDGPNAYSAKHKEPALALLAVLLKALIAEQADQGSHERLAAGSQPQASQPIREEQ